MRNYAGEIAEVLEEAVEIAEKQCPDCNLLAGKETIRQHLGDYAPTLMFYGTYNSGKSTLLNALLDTNVAPTSDAPCTSEISSYKLGDYTVFDTPGIDAPQEHEKLSREHLQHCHAVAFVLSTHGQFDEKKVVQEIVEIYKNKKQLILILNNKAGLTLESGDLGAIRTKLIENCISLSGDSNFSINVPLLLVNAKTAINARDKNSETLLSQSGIPDLERTLLQSLASVKHLQLLRVPLDLLEAAIEDMMRKLNEDPSEQGAALHDAIISKVRDTRFETVQSATLDIRDLRNTLIQSVLKAIHNGQDLNDCAREYLELVQSRTAHRIKESGEKLGKQLQGEDRLNQLMISYNTTGNELSPSLEEGVPFSLPPMVQMQIRQFVTSEQSTEMVKQGLLTLRGLKVPRLKGKWERTLGRWSGNLTKGAGVFLQFALFAFEIYSSYKAQEKYEAEKSRREQEIQESAKQTATSCELDVLETLPEAVHDAFKDFEDQLESEKEMLVGKNNTVAIAKKKVKGLQDKLKNLRSVLLVEDM